MTQNCTILTKKVCIFFCHGNIIFQIQLFQTFVKQRIKYDFKAQNEKKQTNAKKSEPEIFI